MPKSISSVLRGFLGLPAAQPSPERIAAATRQRREPEPGSWSALADEIKNAATEEANAEARRVEALRQSGLDRRTPARDGSDPIGEAMAGLQPTEPAWMRDPRLSGPVSAAIGMGRGEAPEGVEITDGAGIKIVGGHFKNGGLGFSAPEHKTSVLLEGDTRARMRPILDQIERQEAAEKAMLSIGFKWSNGRWEHEGNSSSPFAAIAYTLDYAKANGRFKAMTWLESWHAGDTETRAELAAAIEAGEISY